jgi:hypothetical protein
VRRRVWSVIDRNKVLTLGLAARKRWRDVTGGR